MKTCSALSCLNRSKSLLCSANAGWLLCFLVGMSLSPGFVGRAQTSTLTVALDRPGHPISPTLYGIFFEDINCSADGGLYAEMVRNRSFEESDQPDFWSLVKSGPADAEI